MYTVTITRPDKAAEWIKTISTSTVPVTTFDPISQTCNGLGTRLVYQVATCQLSEAQLHRLAIAHALKFEVTLEDAEAYIRDVGLVILADDCTPTPAPAPERATRTGEIEITREMNPAPDTCHSCHRPILWVRMPSGKAMPLSVATIEQDIAGRRYALSHFADCPNADKHRKKR